MQSGSVKNTELLLEVAVGRNWSNYFQSRYAAYRSGGWHKAGFNIWAAVFGGWWFFYRKIWLGFIIETLIAAFLLGFVRKAAGGEIAAAMFVAERVVVGFVANAFYFRTILVSLDALSRETVSTTEEVAKKFLKRNFGTVMDTAR